METLNRVCSICKANDFNEVFHQKYESIAAFEGAGYSQTIVICNNCGFVYSNPAPAPGELLRYYKAFSNYEKPQRGGRESEQALNKWNRTYDLISRNFPVGYNGNVLEIGCSTATGLSIFKSKGWNVLGVDPSEIAANIARKLYDIEVISGMFERNTVVDRGEFDVIILSHVLEHLLSPELMIDELKNILSKRGLVYIEVPNLLRPFVPMGYFTFEHLNYFTPTTLKSLMNTKGFTIEVELFDNAENIEPFYPVIAAISRKEKQIKEDIDNDFEDACRVIANYKKTSKKTASNVQSRINHILEINNKPRSIGLWGAGIHTSQLLSLTGLSSKSISYIFDNDTKKHGKRIGGVEIIGLRNPENISDFVDSIIISSKAFENEIYDQIKFLKKYGIAIYKLYNH